MVAGIHEDRGVTHRERAVISGANACRSTTRSLVAHAVAFASVVLASLAPGIVASGPVSAAADTNALVAVGPRRLADTRFGLCGCQRVDEFTIRVSIAGRFGIPDSMTAAAITVTATNATADGSVTAYPAGEPAPPTSIVNPRPGTALANSAIVSVGDGGAIDVRSTLPIDVGVELIVDVTGVFVPAERSRAGRFQELEPTRILDSRTPGAPAAGVAPGTSIRLRLPPGVASDATAIAVNVTTIGGLQAGSLSVRPAAVPSTVTSFMSTDGSGRPLASAVIAPVSSSGFVITTTAGGHVIVDVVGWFTGPSAVDDDQGLFVATTPNRLVDSRRDGSRVWPNGTLEVAAGLDASAIASNVTIDRADGNGFVTAYAAGTRQPTASTLNAFDVNDTTANFAITPISNRGSAYYSDSGADLIVDVTGYFTGSPSRATLPVPPNVQPPSRTLLVGDSTLAAVRWYRTTEALLGFPYVYTAESCRRLATASCRGREGFAPTNAVTAIRRASGSFGTVVIMTGYDDWWTVFPGGFDKVVAAARDKGARKIVWLTYREDVRYHGADASDLFVRNNNTLREKVASGLFPDVVLAEWNGYSSTASGWMAGDGVHFNVAGSYAVADYISRKLAYLENRACPMPWEAGAPVDDPCPDPDVHAPVADITGLYRP
jgi:hypothetical protein